MTKVVAYYGGTRIERNRFVFRRTLQKHAYPALDFMYVVRNRPRKRQLEKKYLEKHPSSFEIPKHKSKNEIPKANETKRTFF